MSAISRRKPWPKPDLMIAEVIGSPVAHSKSPMMHQQWIKALGINASFTACQVEPAELANWLDQRRIGKLWRGCSVTAPLKQTAASLVDSLSREARRLGAVNLICNDGKSLKGYNTDLEGISYALAPHVNRTGKIAIAGGGGATMAALAYAIDQGFSDIIIIARDPGRVFDKLASKFSDQFRIVAFERAANAIRGADVIINATPMGSSYGAPMQKNILEALAKATPGAAVLDMNYEPRETKLLAHAADSGLTPVSGFDMLVGQGRRAFELLFGAAPPQKIIFPDMMPAGPVHEPEAA